MTGLDDEGVWRGAKPRHFDRHDLLAHGPIEHLERFLHPTTSLPMPRATETSMPDMRWRRIARSSMSTSNSGLVRVVRLDTAQDVGKAINPQAVIGQIEGESCKASVWR